MLRFIPHTFSDEEWEFMDKFTKYCNSLDQDKPYEVEKSYRRNQDRLQGKIQLIYESGIQIPEKLKEEINDFETDFNLDKIHVNKYLEFYDELKFKFMIDSKLNNLSYHSEFNLKRSVIQKYRYWCEVNNTHERFNSHDFERIRLEISNVN